MVALAWASVPNHQIIQLPKIEDPRGNLSFIECERHIPFSIKRTYWLYDVPGGELREGHAYRTQKEFIVALSGSFDVMLYVNNREIRYSMNRSYYGLYVGNMVWRRLENFSTNAFGLILSSGKYCEDEYLRDFQTYKEMTN
jgi:hypothetical protein